MRCPLLLFCRILTCYKGTTLDETNVHGRYIDNINMVCAIWVSATFCQLHIPNIITTYITTQLHTGVKWQEVIFFKYHSWKLFIGFSYFHSPCYVLMQTTFNSSWHVRFITLSTSFHCILDIFTVIATRQQFYIHHWHLNNYGATTNREHVHGIISSMLAIEILQHCTKP